ncbi:MULTISPECIES: TetR/AcrR family transcriptional regulator [unclassified Nocardioides]|uniref:TetR/AcrR family transcriptional regulator n=1 Tax=unclassified Nocardioides TaxID=2615069 RepID=UPI001E5BF46A|nr:MULTISPECIES: TetR/AcrR family transcriptional regulator [unclassified Nocardioides]
MTARMSADHRREVVLQAATRAFARRGYNATSTDEVAREAGVSQPYVVRIFGTKLELFLQVFERALEQVRRAFVQALDDEGPAAGTGPARLSAAYTALVRDRDLLQVTMHGFSAGHVPRIATAARAGLGRIHETLRGAGWSEQEARDFVARGMLINVLLSIGAPEHGDSEPALAELTRAALGEAAQ